MDEKRPVSGRDWVAREIEKLLKNPPEQPVKNPRAWLYESAKNAAFTQLSKRKKRQEVFSEEDPEPAGPVTDDYRSLRNERDVRKFQERILAVVRTHHRDDVELYCELQRGECTADEQAKRLGEPRNVLDNRHRRARKAVAKAAPVVALVTDPGEGPNRCVVPLSLARELGDSPELVRKVGTHIGGCEKCGRRLDDPNGLGRVVLAVTGALLGGTLLTRLLGLSKAAKITAGATAIVTAAMATALLLPRAPEPGPAQPLPTPRPQPAVIPPAATVARPVRPVQSAPPSRRPTGTTTTTQVPPAGTTAPSLTPSGGGANPARSNVTGSSVRPRRIVAGDGECADEPHYSVVRVTVTPGATSAKILLTAAGTTSPLPMSGSADGTEWTGRVGSVPNEDAHGRLGVAVEIVGANGPRTVELGHVELCECRR
ncbi:hypothetical protein [Amycolatopsis sp. NPDC098790]|uniref:hypothetical protein n=1 Tax=Amycolatopsis sp. NPDC098790 TaxID=3363939 RepID=UPI0037F69597